MTRRWPLLLLALPAGVATWSGWVGLGELTGFGPVKPFPGISEFTINTAVTLPVGVEAYAAYALHAWLAASGASEFTRAFAKWSALGSLLLGMLGQVGYHLLAQTGVATAPWEVTTAVSCLPVLVLGMGAALGHMLAGDAHATPAQAPGYVPEPPLPPQVPVSREVYDWAAEHDAFPPHAGTTPPVVVDIPAAVPAAAPELDVEPETVEYVPGDVSEDLLQKAASRFLANVVAGDVPGVRRIKDELGIGQPKAQQVRAYLAQLATQ